MAPENYAISTRDDTASLGVYVDGVLVTTYDYAGGAIELSKRDTPVDVPLDQLLAIVESIGRWVYRITQELRPETGAISELDEHYIKDPVALTLRGVFKVSDGKVTDATYANATGLTTFDARGKRTLTFAEFVAWRGFLHRLAREAQDFS